MLYLRYLSPMEIYDELIPDGTVVSTPLRCQKCTAIYHPRERRWVLEWRAQAIVPGQPGDKLQWIKEGPHFSEYAAIPCVSHCPRCTLTDADVRRLKFVLWRLTHDPLKDE